MLKEWIDKALSAYYMYAGRLRIDIGEELFFKWEALVMCLFMALPAGVKKEYYRKNYSMERLLDEMEQLLKLFYVRKAGDQVGISGYTVYSRPISCFSIYSLLIYMFMKDASEREEFYRIMIICPFCYEAVNGEIPAEVCSSVLDRMKISYRFYEQSLNKKCFLRSGKMVEEQVKKIVELNKYIENVDLMECEEYKDKIVEGYFLLNWGEEKNEQEK